MPNDLKKFREAGVDAFTGGFQVGSARTYSRQPHIWANNKAEIKRILLTAFPKQATNPLQRERAGRWARIIHLYYRLNYTHVQVAEEIGGSANSIRQIAYNINRVRKGFRANDGEPRGLRPPGRQRVLQISSPMYHEKTQEDNEKDQGPHLH